MEERKTKSCVWDRFVCNGERHTQKFKLIRHSLPEWLMNLRSHVTCEGNVCSCDLFLIETLSVLGGSWELNFPSLVASMREIE